MAGGYREGSGRSKSGYYKGIYCGSTYELCWVIHSIDHDVKFTRFPGRLERDGLRYYPDFLLDDGKTIIETKGYEKQDSVDKKTKLAESFGYIVNVLRKEDLEYAFSYVKSKYKTGNFQTLYDEYRPSYTHVCDCCGTEFGTDRIIKTETKFCSKLCSGKYRKKTNISRGNNINYQKVSKSMTGKKMPEYTRKYKMKWITDGTVNTKIKFDDPIPMGYRRGRI